MGNQDLVTFNLRLLLNRKPYEAVVNGRNVKAKEYFESRVILYEPVDDRLAWITLRIKTSVDLFDTELQFFFNAAYWTGYKAGMDDAKEVFLNLKTETDEAS